MAKRVVAEYEVPKLPQHSRRLPRLCRCLGVLALLTLAVLYLPLAAYVTPRTAVAVSAPPAPLTNASAGAASPGAAADTSVANEAGEAAARRLIARARTGTDGEHDDALTLAWLAGRELGTR